MLVDALTFLAPGRSRRSHPGTRSPDHAELSRGSTSITSEVEGLHAVWRQPILRGMVVADLALNLAFGLFGTVFLLYVNQEVGFDPGILGMIFAVGGGAVSRRDDRRPPAPFRDRHGHDRVAPAGRDR